jgi:hypothetical protein
MTNEIIRGRQIVVPLINKSGGAVAAGDVVILGSATAGSFTTTTEAAQVDDMVGVSLEAIAGDATGRICLFGYVPVINLASAATLGAYLFTHTVAKQGTPSATDAAGSFGQALAATATPPAILWGRPSGAAGTPGGGDVATDAIWTAKGDLAVATANDTATVLPAGATGAVLTALSTEATGLVWSKPRYYPTIGISGALTVAQGALTLVVPVACTITNVRAWVGTAPTGADIIVDVLKNGTTIFTTPANRPTIAATTLSDLAAAPDVTAIAANDIIAVSVAQIGSTIAGSDLCVMLEVTVP